MDQSRTGSVKGPVVFILGIERWIEQAPVGVGAGNRHIHAAHGINCLPKAIKIHHDGMIYLQAQVVQDRILEETRASARVITKVSELVGGIDPLHSDGGNIHPQISRDGDQRNLRILRAHSRNHDRIRSKGGTRACIGAKQQDINRFRGIYHRLSLGDHFRSRLLCDLNGGGGQKGGS